MQTRGRFVANEERPPIGGFGEVRGQFYALRFPARESSRRLAEVR
jgi:hypothetical protein